MTAKQRDWEAENSAALSSELPEQLPQLPTWVTTREATTFLAPTLRKVSTGNNE